MSRKFGWLIGGGFAFTFVVIGVAATVVVVIKSGRAGGRTYNVPELLTEFENDMRTAKRKFIGKRIEVVGVVGSTWPEGNETLLIFRGRGAKKTELFLMGSLLIPRNEIRPGQTVKFVGVVHHVREVGENFSGALVVGDGQILDYR